jgi:hypothetical protein
MKLYFLLVSIPSFGVPIIATVEEPPPDIVLHLLHIGRNPWQ